NRDVNGSPPDILFGSGVLNDAFILGGTACLFAGIGDQRPLVRNAGTLFLANRLGVKFRRRRVSINLTHRDTMAIQINCLHAHSPKDWYFAILLERSAGSPQPMRRC